MASNKAVKVVSLIFVLGLAHKNFINFYMDNLGVECTKTAKMRCGYTVGYLNGR